MKNVQACVRAERALGSTVVLRIRHRDLCTRPERTLDRIGRFLQTRLPDECARPLRALGPAASPPPIATPDTHAIPGAARALSRALSEQRPRFRGSSQRSRQLVVSARRNGDGGDSRDERTLRQQVDAAVRSAVPEGAAILVVSRGDESLLALEGRRASHFPQTTGGVYAGYYPSDSAEAIGHLEELRSAGADYLLFPRPSCWWLDHYAGFLQHLETRYEPVKSLNDSCIIVSLRPARRRRRRITIPEGADLATVTEAASPVTLDEPSLLHSFEVVDRNPPPRRPQPLPGTLWAVTMFYNPARYRTSCSTIAGSGSIWRRRVSPF